jgi:hypothetical protein
MRTTVLDYMNGSKFSPQVEVSPEAIAALVGPTASHAKR